MHKIAVVILNWNGKHFLEKFLPSVTQFSSLPGAEIIVADNGSNDGSVDFLKNFYPSVRVIRFDKNYGFTGGYNKALAQVDAEYFVLLNSDVEVSSDWLNFIVEKMDADKTIGAAMPKMIDFANRSKFEYAGACGGFIDRFGYPFCRGRVLSVIENDKGQYNDEMQCFWASGACMFVRAALYKQLGGLDDSFFAHMEEIDLCWRLQNAGYKIMVYPQVEVYHVGGGTLPNNNPRKLYLNYRNNLLLLYKNMPLQQAGTLIPIRMLLDWLSAFVYLLQRKWSFFMAVPKAHRDYFKMRHKVRGMAKTEVNKKFCRANFPVYHHSLVGSFFIRKLKTFKALW